MDIEKTMAFIVEQQAKFEADITRVNATLDRHINAIAALVQWARVQSDRHDALVQTLAESDRRWSEAKQRLAQAQEDLARAQAGTEKRLNDFIAQVGRYVAGGNGRKGRRGGPNKSK